MASVRNRVEAVFREVLEDEELVLKHFTEDCLNTISHRCHVLVSD